MQEIRICKINREICAIEVVNLIIDTIENKLSNVKEKVRIIS